MQLAAATIPLPSLLLIPLFLNSVPPPPPKPRSDSHTKQLMRALQCFMIDFWDGTECKVSAEAGAVEELDNLPTRPGESKCIHLAGNGRICFVQVVLVTSLINNPAVSGVGCGTVTKQQMRLGGVGFSRAGPPCKRVRICCALCSNIRCCVLCSIPTPPPPSNLTTRTPPPSSCPVAAC